ncbi:MAG: Uncharacterised protein [SAR116 cluster bacterium]|nr:MAG: Uncharacterised protein [SAR116 cluster bacterium]
MKHSNRRRHKGGFGKTRADMLGRTFYRRIDCIEVKRIRLGNIAGDHRALEEMDIVHLLDNARRIIDVGQIGFAVGVAFHINHMNRRAGRTVMHP